MEEIKEFVLNSLKQNDKYCYLNDCAPSSYMDGANEAYKKVLDYIERKEGKEIKRTVTHSFIGGMSF